MSYYTSMALGPLESACAAVGEIGRARGTHAHAEIWLKQRLSKEGVTETSPLAFIYRG